MIRLGISHRHLLTWFCPLLIAGMLTGCSGSDTATGSTVGADPNAGKRSKAMREYMKTHPAKAAVKRARNHP